MSGVDSRQQTLLHGDTYQRQNALLQDKWRTLLSLLITKQNSHEIVTSIVSNLSRDIQNLMQHVESEERRVTTVESTIADLVSRVTALESAHTVSTRHLIIMQLRIDDSENCDCRNNICLSEIPEATTGSNLKPL